MKKKEKRTSATFGNILSEREAELITRAIEFYILKKIDHTEVEDLNILSNVIHRFLWHFGTNKGKFANERTDYELPYFAS